jgi:phosphoribosylformimino-5-aminoimidazole carboxamide ribotide isomerase
MHVIPVMDLQGGQVVRGIAGRRDTYQPIQGKLARTADPGEVARAFVSTLSREDVYVADLDAIAGARPSWQVLQAIAAAGLRLWVDAGVRDVAAARQLADFPLDSGGTTVARIIVALESVDGPAAVERIVRDLGWRRVIFSLDLNRDRPISSVPEWREAEPLKIARQIAAMGVQHFIVLDLAQVGTGQGGATLGLCRQIAASMPGVAITTGGGVSSVEDLVALARAGVDVALVSSALHDGRIARADLEQIESRHITGSGR